MSTVIEVNVPGAQGPQGPEADLTVLRGTGVVSLFSAEVTYQEGSFVLSAGKEYVAVTTTTLGSFIANEWQEVSVQSNEARIAALEIAVAALTP